MATDAKRIKVDKDERLEKFLLWCDDVKLETSDKVYLSKNGTVADYGMLAKVDIEEGHVLFSIPREALLHQATTSVRKVLEDEKCCLDSASGWVPLLLSLLHEYTSPLSRWKPYLSLWTDFRTLDQPMFWSEEQRDELLKGTGIPEAVEADVRKVQDEYRSIVLPFMKTHPELWDPEEHTLELYTALVAFVMAYSFQEPVDDDEDEEDEKQPNPPMMVPMADMLNHVSEHNANLEYTPACLKMVSTRSIRKGEEIFNTYGEMPNWQLLHMYGFVQPFPSNSNDTADVSNHSIYTAALKVAENEAACQLLADKWSALRQMKTVEEKGAFIFDQSGCLTYSELYTTLKVLCMSAEEFTEFRGNEGWEEDDDDDVEEAVSFRGLARASGDWKRLLHQAAGATLDSYSQALEEDRKLMDTQAGLSSRERRALHVRYGQKNILHKIYTATS